MNRKAKVLLVVALVAVVAMAFRVSWNALRDVARAIGADNTAAMLYPFSGRAMLGRPQPSPAAV